MADQSESPKFIRAAAVLIRYGGVSAMWLTRRLRDDGFPAPCHFGTAERFFRVDQLDEWDRAMIERGINASRTKPTPPARQRKAVRP